MIANAKTAAALRALARMADRGVLNHHPDSPIAEAGAVTGVTSKKDAEIIGAALTDSRTEDWSSTQTLNYTYHIGELLGIKLEIGYCKEFAEDLAKAKS